MAWQQATDRKAMFPIISSIPRQRRLSRNPPAVTPPKPDVSRKRPGDEIKPDGADL
jgi:hypothetical protein